MDQQEKKVKFLIIRFSSIGDIVLTTPVIRNLKKQVEHAEVHFLTKQAFSPILKSNPYIYKVHVLTDFNPLIKSLKAESFDYIIDLHHNLRSKRVKNALKKMSFSFDKLNLKKWMLVKLKINRLPDLHIVDRYLETIKFFIEKPDSDGLDFFIPEDEEYVLPLIKKYVVIVIGANHYTKQMTQEKLTELCNSIQLQVVLIGGKNDVSKAEIIVQDCEKELIDLTGKLSINQSASVIKNAEWVLTPDTGMMHIAAAYHKKIVSYWGNTVPEFGMTPYLPNKKSLIFENKDLKCRPCSKIGYKQCPKKHFKCIRDLNIEEIVSYIS